MTKNLVIVESPAKAKTIERYLGDDFKVLASYGHVRDLPENPGKGKLGVDVEHDFAPEYVISEDRRKQVSAIGKEAGRATTVFLATDLDREGEAIAWHVAEAAEIPSTKTRRVTFSEITEGAIRDAFAHPRGIDMHLVDAQQTRRIVDRMVGYTLSPLISRKVRGGLSAGRVQSVAVRLVVERERQINAFTPREYWTLKAILETDRGERFSADVVRLDGAPINRGGELGKKEIAVSAERAAQDHATALRRERPLVESIGVRQSKSSPRPPFITSTLQQEASRKLGYSPKRTMSIAQRLYEGVEIDGEPVGLITYMRTDSTAMAGVAMGEARAVIAERFGDDYTMPKGRVFGKVKGAQEAHEAIRPSSFRRDPDSMARWIKPDELKLYRLIWQRAIASQMQDKRLETTTVELIAGRYGLRASATRTLFDGFSRVYTEGRDDGPEEEAEGASLPALKEGDVTSVVDVESAQHFTEPPPRYSEATLIKALEEHRIGRPSTYAATISTILDRGYVKVVDKRLRPELIGEIVTDLLVQHFAEFVDLEFTARMEERLDEIARGEREWVPLLREFYDPFRQLVDEKRKELKRKDFTTEETDETCSEGHPMVIRLGRNGRFLACSLYPEHKESRPLPGEEAEEITTDGVGETCPECHEGTLVAKRGRFGVFAGCSRYPDCSYIHRTGPKPPPPLPFEVACPTCGEGRLVARVARRTGNEFYGCGRYPRCDFTTNHKPVGVTHDADGGPVAQRADGTALCLRCGAPVDLPDPVVVGASLPGGEPDPAAVAPRPKRAGGRGRTPAGGGSGRSSRSRAPASAA
jgi:DNA topoisomerase-1